MTIASAFNDIAVAQGGTAAKSGAITAAIDALNDALAGSDQPQAKTIEQAVRLLGEHIGGGGGGTVKCYILNVDDWGTPLSTTDVTVLYGGTGITLESDTFEIGGETYSCISFAAEVGDTYAVTSGDMTLAGGSIGSASDPGHVMPSDSSTYPNTMLFIVPNSAFVALVEVSR